MARDHARIASWVLPPGVHPNNAMFAGNTALPRPLTWQRRAHLRHRHTILAGIGHLLEQTAPANLAPLSDMNRKTWMLARKLEVLLFLQSNSLQEYSNPDSLVRRVQALTASIVNRKLRRQMGEQDENENASARSSASSVVGTDDVTMQQASAAPRVMPVPSFFTTPHFPTSIFSHRRARPHRPASRLCTLLFGELPETSQHVWSFVDGAQIMRCRAVSRVAYAVLPASVTSLQLSCNAMKLALKATRTGASALCGCTNLRELEVASLASGMQFGKRSMQATNCAQRFLLTHGDHEELIRALAQHLRRRVFPHLTKLTLVCLFSNEEANGEATVLLQTLMTGCCPALEELCLPGNSFGDPGAALVAELLRARVCPQLSRLDLRRNFISEQGIHSLCAALTEGCTPQLAELCLGGNMLTDACFHHLLTAIESRQLQRLQFLGIEMNYLGARSLELLGRLVGQMVCPLLAQISYGGNCIANEDARRLISAAIYEGRRAVWRLRGTRRGSWGERSGREGSAM